MYLFCISCKYIVATIKVPTLVQATKEAGNMEYFSGQAGLIAL